MQHNRSSKLLVLAGLLAILTAGASAANGLTVDSADKTIWDSEQDRTLNVNWTCSGTTSDEVTITDPSGTDWGFSRDSNEIAIHASDFKSGYGEYKASLTCNTSSSSTTLSDTFRLKELVVERTSPAGTIQKYQGQNLQLTFAISINGATGSPNEDNLDSEVLLENQELAVATSSFSNGEYSVRSKIPSDFPSGEYQLKTRILYDAHSAGTLEVDPSNRGSSFVKVLQPYQVEILDKIPSDGEVKYQNLESLKLDVNISHKGTPVNDWDSSDFYLKISDTSSNDTALFDDGVVAQRIKDVEGGYNLQVGSPSLSLGRYRFTIGMDKNRRQISNFTVSKFILLNGQITDSAGKPVNAQIQVAKPGFTEPVNVRNGKYTGEVLPGEYNFSVQFPEAALILEGVTFQDQKDAEGRIRYDDIPLNTVGDELEGVTVANAVAVWFGYPFENGEMTMQYDTAKVNPSDLKVYECVGWNIETVSCYQGSSWEPVGVKRSWINPTAGTVRFPVTPYNVSEGNQQLLNGYMVVKNTPMNLQYVEFSNDRIRKGGDLTLNGKVVTPSGEGVRNAVITARFIDASTGSVVGSATSVRSGSNGAFSITKSVPNENGNYRVVIEGERKPYSGFSREIQQGFETFTQKQISLSGPDTATFYVGADSNTEFTIQNSGQAPLNDVRISVRNLNNDWYSFKKSEWNRLEPGDAVKAVMVTNVPASQCQSACQEYQQMTVEVTSSNGGQKIEDASQVTAQISQDQPQQVNSSTNDDTNKGGFSAPKLPNTGEFLERQGSVNIALGLIIVFTLVLATAIKKKNSSSSSDRSRPVSSGGEMRKARPNVSGTKPQESSEEEPEEEDVEEDEPEEDDESFECSVCGEEFDTESARDLHEQAIHD